MPKASSLNVLNLSYSVTNLIFFQFWYQYRQNHSTGHRDYKFLLFLLTFSHNITFSSVHFKYAHIALLLYMAHERKTGSLERQINNYHSFNLNIIENLIPIRKYMTYFPCIFIYATSRLHLLHQVTYVLQKKNSQFHQTYDLTITHFIRSSHRFTNLNHINWLDRKYGSQSTLKVVFYF